MSARTVVTRRDLKRGRDVPPKPVVGEPAWCLSAAQLAGMAGLPLSLIGEALGDVRLECIGYDAEYDDDVKGGA